MFKYIHTHTQTNCSPPFHIDLQHSPDMSQVGLNQSLGHHQSTSERILASEPGAVDLSGFEKDHGDKSASEKDLSASGPDQDVPKLSDQIDSPIVPNKCTLWINVSHIDRRMHACTQRQRNTHTNSMNMKYINIHIINIKMTPDILTVLMPHRICLIWKTSLSTQKQQRYEHTCSHTQRPPLSGPLHPLFFHFLSPFLK